MAARGSIPMIMKQAGIDMLPPSAGIPFIRKELTYDNATTEIVVAQSLGMMLDEFDDTGGLDTDESGILDVHINESKQLMIQVIESMGLYSGLMVKSTFDPTYQGFLFDHQINGTAVLPGVMGVEAMVSAARILYPDMHLKAVKNVAFYAPFKFYKSESRDVFVNVQYSQEVDDVVAHCTLIGKRRLLGQETEEVKTHFTAKVYLAKSPVEKPAPTKVKLTIKKGAKLVEAEDIYKLYFHGPAYQVIDRSWKLKDEIIGQYAKDLPPNHVPDDKVLMTLPRLLELGFQTAGIMEMGTNNRMGLPSGIDTLFIYDIPDQKKEQLFAVVNQVDDGYDISVVNKKGEIFIDLSGYKTAEFVMNMDEKLVAPLEAVLV